MRRCGRCSSRLRVDSAFVAYLHLTLQRSLGGAPQTAYIASRRMAPYWGTPPKLLLARAAKRKPFVAELLLTATCGLGEADAAPFVAKRCKPRLSTPTRISEDRRHRCKQKGPPVKTRSPCLGQTVLWSSLTSTSDMSFARVLTSCAQRAQWP
jgi:hypothetical protein